MTRCRHSWILGVAAVVLFGAESHGQSLQTANTYALDDPANQPAATLDDIAWLSGSWTGQAFGERIEETWNLPAGGSMVGMFKLFKGNDAAMYELFIAVEEQGSLVIKLKHFGADFKGWEGKDDYVTFPLVKIEENAAHFAGLSYHRIDENELHTYLVIKSQGQVREEKLVFRRRGRH